MAKKQKHEPTRRPAAKKTAKKKTAKRSTKKSTKRATKKSAKRSTKKSTKVGKKAKAKKAVRKRRKRKRMPASAAVVKKLAFDGLDFPAADKKIKGKIPLADALKKFSKLKRAWDRGRLLRGLQELAGTGATIQEAAPEIGLETGELSKLLETDNEAADIWHTGRLALSAELKKILIEQARAGKVSAINNIIKILRNELAGRTHTDLHKLTINQMLEVTGVSRTSLHKWFTKYGLQRNSDGTFDLGVFIPWMMDFAANKATRGVTGGTTDPLRAKRARKLDMDMARELGELLERDSVMAGLLARTQLLINSHQRKAEELARLCMNQPFEKAKELLTAGFDEICRELCEVPAVLRLPEKIAKKFQKLLEELKPETSEVGEMQ